MNQPFDALDHLFERAVAEHRVPGVVAIVADRTGIRYAKPFGVRDTATGVPMELDSVFGIASMTKTLSATIVLQLIERDEISLDTPVGDVLPAYDELLVLDGFDGTEPILRPARRRGTVRHLLTNTSGLAHPTWNAKLLRYIDIAGIGLTELSGTRRVFDVPFVCDPDTEFHYGMSTDWVGLLIEAVTGRPFPVVLREQVLAPLAMHDTVVLRSAEQLDRAVSVHVRDAGDGRWVPVPGASYYAPGVVEPEIYPAGGCLYSTALDFLRFQSALLGDGSHDGTQLLRPGTVDAMFRNQLGPLEVGLLRTEIPAASFDLPLHGWKWGLGLLVNEDAGPHGRSAGSGGWGGGWNTFYWVDRARGLTAAMYTQTAPFYEPGIIDLYGQFESLASA
jgi:methyl acetate hydrolase